MDEKGSTEKARRQLDDALGTASWETPFTRGKQRTRSSDRSSAPSWWHGEEDASQTFLAAMGMRQAVDR